MINNSVTKNALPKTAEHLLLFKAFFKNVRQSTSFFNSYQNYFSKKPLFQGFLAFLGLFPLDCAAGFGCEVIEDTVDAVDLCCDTLSYLMEHCIGYLLYRS